MANINRSRALNLIPEKKLQNALEATIASCHICRTRAKIDSNLCVNCRVLNAALVRYHESNIPASYWDIDMDPHFVGFKGLKDKYNDIIKDIHVTYNSGRSIIL